ncbi:hypothetical protein [Amnibacterium setariae]|uniref:Uncharacterized protein n=1 Tax=Amnibacterium setariae TaxID=2306585 RepID=A0A3A1TZ38_9MICO|nr:hypothetical protein [Amnibacterium setariae]RIX27945.1 hypothetical protein D1781_10520 [Amnibacterium setariae]
MISSVFAVLAAVLIALPALRPRKVEAAVGRWSQRFGLGITADVRPFLLRRRRATWIGYAAGVAVGIELSTLLRLVVPPAAPALLQGFVVQGGALLVGGLGLLAGGWLAASLTPPAGPRVARERAVAVADYVEPFERRLVPAAAVVATVSGLLPLLLGAPRERAATALAAGLSALLVAAVAEAVAVLVTTRPQRAGTAAQLAWADALRADVARTVLGAGALLAVGTIVVSAPVVIAAVDRRADESADQLLIAYGVLALLAVLSVRAMRQGSARYFLRRLWPATAAELARNERVGTEVER